MATREPQDPHAPAIETRAAALADRLPPADAQIVRDLLHRCALLAQYRDFYCVGARLPAVSTIPKDAAA